MSRLLVLVYVLLLSSSTVAAQSSAGPVAVQSTPPTAGPRRNRAHDARPNPADWTGPRVALSYRLYSLHDSQGGGRVSTAGFSGFLPTRYVRAGGGLEAGARRYDYADSEGLLSGNLFVGYQHLHDLGRFVPYAVVLGELGILFEKRFHTPQTQLIRGAGLELGANVNLIRSLYVGVGLSFMLYTIDGLAYDTFGLRLSIGL